MVVMLEVCEEIGFERRSRVRPETRPEAERLRHRTIRFHERLDSRRIMRGMSRLRRLVASDHDAPATPSGLSVDRVSLPSDLGTRT